MNKIMFSLILFLFIFPLITTNVSALVTLKGDCGDNLILTKEGNINFNLKSNGDESVFITITPLSMNPTLINTTDLGELKPNSEKTVALPIKIDGNPGSYAVVFNVYFFTKQSPTKHNLLFSCVIDYKQRALLNVSRSIFSSNIPSGKIGTVGIHLYNINEKNITWSELRLAIPDGFIFDAVPRNFSLAEAENKFYTYRIKNVGAAPNSSYAIIFVVNAVVDGVHKTTVDSNVVITTYPVAEVVKPKEVPIQVIQILGILVLVVLLLYMYRRKK